MSSVATNPWLEIPRPRPTASRRLFCFPHAGAGSAPYRTWLPELSDDCEVVMVILPGRDRRGRETPMTRMSDFLQDLMPSLKPLLDLPFAFFGHSMGAILAFEAARELRRRGGPQPYHLFLSGRAAEPDSLPPIHRLSDDDFLRVLDQRYSGIPAELRNEPELLRMFMPILRADLRLLETHQSPAEPPLDCPITALGGQNDLRAGAAQLRQWGRHTTAAHDVLIFPGGHFYLFDQRQAVLDELRTRLLPSAAPPSALVFPGQGSQHKGMGKDLFERFPDLVSLADRVLGYSLAELCLQDSGGRLRQTQYTQPALFAVNALSFLAGDQQASFLAGHSLGEYNALWAAGCFDFETGLGMVKKRGELMARAPGGGMAAVMSLGAESVLQLIAQHAPEVDLANDNSPDQLVLSGPAEALEALTPALQQAGGRVVRLNVSAAFHSRYMAQAAEEFEDFLQRLEIQDPQRPVLSNVTGLPYQPGTVRRLLAEQIRRPVKWTASMQFLLSQGVSELREVGPGQVLTRLWSSTQQAFEKGLPPLAAVAAPRTEPSEPAISAEPLAEISTKQKPTTLAEGLGSSEFRSRYHSRLAYLAGTCGGAGSAESAVAMAQAGLLGVVGSAGQSPAEVSEQLSLARQRLAEGAQLALGLVHTPENSALELALVRTAIDHQVDLLEATGFLQPEKSLAVFRFAARAEHDRPRHLLARVARPDVAAELLAPPSATLLRSCVEEKLLSPADAALAQRWPLVSDLCADSEAGGLSANGSWLVLLPALKKTAREARQQHDYGEEIMVGACGQLGSPQALAAAFMIGADFVMTTSINACTPQSHLCGPARDLLAGVGLGETTYAPALETFELGGRQEVVKKGSLFAARAQKLYDLYRRYESLEALSVEDRRWLERQLLKNSFEQAWKLATGDLSRLYPMAFSEANESARLKMSLLFKWYLWRSARLAERGASSTTDFAVPCDGGIAALNSWLHGTNLQSWTDRHVDVLAQRLMDGAADVLSPRSC